jgi:hypothetical protein
VRTEGDDWFEEYLLTHGYMPGEHEPDLSSAGVTRRPDFLPSRGGERIACEVEEFGRNSKLEGR